MRRRPKMEFNVTTEQLEQMFAPSNILTTQSWEKIWQDNIIENLRMNNDPRPMSELVGMLTHHIAWVIGAGPSVRKLKKYGKDFDPAWGVFVTDHSLLPALEAGLKPTLVITMDGHQSTEPVILEGFDLLKNLYPETPVLVDLVCCPSVVERLVPESCFWFRSAGNPDHILTKFMQRNVPRYANMQMGHGGNVGSVCLVMVKFFGFARHVGIIGLDSAMEEGTTRKGYFYDRVMPDNHQYVQVSDVYGRPITTMANLHNYKWWADHFCYQNDEIEWLNANDGGFLGVASATHNYDHFKFCTLPEAIAYLKGHGEDD